MSTHGQHRLILVFHILYQSIPINYTLTRSHPAPPCAVFLAPLCLKKLRSTTSSLSTHDRHRLIPVFSHTAINHNQLRSAYSSVHAPPRCTVLLAPVFFPAAMAAFGVGYSFLSSAIRPPIGAFNRTNQRRYPPPAGPSLRRLRVTSRLMQGPVVLPGLPLCGLPIAVSIYINS